MYEQLPYDEKKNQIQLFLVYPSNNCQCIEDTWSPILCYPLYQPL